jgi:ABC-2 type transport system permease protein
MTSQPNTIRSNLRIVWAITAKDILDGLKNRQVLSNLLVVLVVAVLLRMLPAWLRAGEPPCVLIYDAGHSRLGEALKESSRVRAYVYPSQAMMEQQLADGDVPELGLLIPAGFDQAVSSGSAPQLEGYVMRWVAEAAAADLISRVEQEVAALLGQPVRINTQTTQPYPRPDSWGQPFVASTALLLALTMTGILVTPQLMLEEKQTRTIQALLVSPARSDHLVVAKALSGLFYSVTVASVVLAFYGTLVAHWGLAILTVLVGSLFALAWGLLLGSLLEVPQLVSLSGWGIVSLLLAPVYLAVMGPILPDGVNAVIPWVPTVALGYVIRTSFAESVALGAVGPRLAYVGGCSVVVLAVVAWQLRLGGAEEKPR